MSLAKTYDVENVVEDVEYRLKEHYLPLQKDWSKYKLGTLFPTMYYLGSIFARYDIFQEEEQNWLS